MRKRFDQELQFLNSDIVKMGGLIETAIARAVDALIGADQEVAEEAMRTETEVDRLEQAIENRCLRLLLQEQPVAGDLRMISSALKMITDMERIGDQAANIAEMIMRQPYLVDLERLAHIRCMGDAVQKMVGDAVDAFVGRDLDLAQGVVTQDDVVDRLFDEVREQLIDIIRSNSGDVEAAIDMLMIAKYFERIGDHTVNISGWVVYAITGRHRNGEQP